ncbi:D-aminoacylase [Xanthomonas hyacinthi]|uniref:Aminoacylase n=2 Tax=Xanthomonas hyacinthi TaxID=56455 RepID=A0A2S7EX58_9XANT|nr:D-aminoacylase [Xanthomonas hyacinthi]PPU97732.1 aminoacylase [Xanthomonas hyacinthi]QGY77075.1 D-aminoacylase [Xanthomonas hyacinthi]
MLRCLPMALLPLLPAATACAATTVIDRVMIVDGTGAPAYAGAVRIADGRIVAVGRLRPAPGEPRVDGRGLVLAPGFIDTHSHHDAGMFERPDMATVTSQGVTTLIVGQDGFSQTPLASLFERLQANPLAVNLGSYSGHNTLRAQVLGTDARRPASEREIAGMSRLLEADMEAGAFGLSTGLMYEPGAFSTTEEVVALAQVAARRGGRYISHVRNEAFELDSAIDEAILVGRRTGMPVQISHLKIAVRKRWGQADAILRKLDQARAEGIDLSADVYPYTYWQTTMRIMFPNKDYDDRRGLAFNFAESTPPEELRVALFRPDPSLQGRSIAQIAQARGQDPVTAYIGMEKTLAAYERTHASELELGKVEAVIGTSMSEDDVATFLRWPHSNVCSDGFELGHPRGHGTFTRVLGRYVRERGVLSLEQAVHRMTGLAAAHLGITDRGVIRPGAWADLVLFDPDTVADRATLENPAAQSVGIAQVWVAGQTVFAAGHALPARPGQVVRRQGDAPFTAVAAH